MDNQVDISFIVPIYRGRHYMPAMVEMIEKNIKMLNEMLSVELIFVNDDPNEKLYELENKHFQIVTLQTDINRGIHGARVYGLEHARGEYVIFLDQDDKLYSNYLHSQLDKIVDADAIVCAGIEDNRPMYGPYWKLDDVITKKFVLDIGNHIVTPGQVIIKRSAISANWKRHIVSISGADDYFLWICMLTEGKKFVKNDDILFEHVISGKNQSGNWLAMTESEQCMMDIIKENNILEKEEFERLRTCVEKIHIERLAMLQKMKRKYDILVQLVIDEARGDFFCNRFLEKKIAIYGAGELGIAFAEQCIRANKKVLGFIDKNVLDSVNGISVYRIETIIRDVDAIVISLIDDYEVLKKQLKELYHVPVYVIRELA